MNTASDVIYRLNELLEGMPLEADEQLVSEGWHTEALQRVRTTYVQFRQELISTGEVPAKKNRPRNLVRVMDSWGVTSGDLSDRLASFDLALSRIPEN